MRKRSTRRVNRVLRAKKIRDRKNLCKEIGCAEWFVGRPDGRFADRLFYNKLPKNRRESCYSDKKKMDSLNYRMEDYYNESLS